MFVNRLKHFIPVLVVYFALAGAAAAQWPQTKSDLKPDPDLVFGRLKNGFRYVLMNNKEPADRVSMHLNVQAGSLQESEKQRGLAHFLEHMLFEGTTHFPSGELVKYFQSIGMQFGPDANAHTGFAETVYDVLLPDGKKTSLEQALIVMQDYAEGALLLESEVAQERGVVLAEKRTRDSVGYRTFVATANFQFANTRIVRRLPIGIESVLKSADRRRVKAYYDTFYRPERMMLVMVGDFNIDVAQTLIADRFAGLKARAPAGAEIDLGDLLQPAGILPDMRPEVFQLELVEILVVIALDRDPLRVLDGERNGSEATIS